LEFKKHYIQGIRGPLIMKLLTWFFILTDARCLVHG